MASLRTIISALMSKGVLSRGWNSIVTGVAFVFVAYVLGTATEGDSAAPFVAVLLAVTGAWQLDRGLRMEFRRRTKSTDQAS
jgi:membrane-associated PAP2 superfamily phosphatase